MKRILAFIVVLSLAGLVAFQAYQAYKARAYSPAGDPAGSGRGPGGGGMAALMRVPLVEAVVSSEGFLENTATLVGSLRPIAEVQVMSKIAGRLEKVLADVGDPVSEGQLLTQVESREIEEQIRQLDAALSVTQATVRQREAELANMTRQVKRYRELYEENLVSRQDLDDLITRQQSAEAQLELSKAQVKQAEANLSHLRISLENTRIYSPMNGFVSKRLVHPGALLNPNTAIVNLVDLRTLRSVMNVVERDIVRIQRGAPAQVTVDAFPGRAFPGKVQRVSPVLDPATRTGEVEIYVSNPRLDLKAEMFARVTLDLGGQRKGLLVPREAVVYKGEQSGVFVLDGNSARFRPVQVGLTQRGDVEIVRGLNIGERVVTMGASLLKDGDQVRLKTDSMPGGKPGAEPSRRMETNRS